MKLRKTKIAANSEWNSLAENRGIRDGKGEHPNPNWPSNSVPFLNELHRRALEKAQSEILRTREYLNDLVKQTIQRDDDVRQYNLQRSSLLQDISKTEKRIDGLQSVVDGYQEENTVGKFARTKAISDAFYYPILFILAAGEVALTAPALIDLFGDIQIFAWLVAAAVGLLTVTGAHLIGISLKLKLDRQRPQEGWVIKLLAPLLTFLLLAVIVLAYLRSGQVLGKIASFNIIESSLGRRIFLICFFIFLQLAFMAVATKLSFLHYSKPESELSSAKRELDKLKTKDSEYTKKLQELSSVSYLNEDLINVERERLINSIGLIETEYQKACAIYVDANIHSRRDELNGAHPSLISPKFEIDVDTFKDLKMIAQASSNNH